jgi:uncharacterized repeat protein (TIGR01451 family)
LGTKIQVQSNTVTVKVVEVAGISVTPIGYSGNPVGGNVIYVDFRITNLGNDPTQFFIPGSAHLTNGTQPTGQSLQIIGYDLTGNAPVTLTSATYVNIPNSGKQTGPNGTGDTGLLNTNGIFQQNGSVTVRVPVRVNNSLNATTPILVRLGDTPEDGSSTTTPKARLQNQVFSAGSGDLYTVDNADSLNIAGEAGGSPKNGDSTFHRQEASAIQGITPVEADAGDAPTDLTAIDSALSNIYPLAYHFLDGQTYLGDRVDAEFSNQPNIDASGDDTNGSPNDEDGVTFPLTGSTPVLYSGQSNILTVKASRNGVLNAWIDWNQDGDWNDSGEQIATNTTLSTGNNTLTLSVPNTAPHGVTYTRFRFSTQSNVAATGEAPNGEVEDHKVNLALPAPVACSIGLLNDGFESPVIGSSNAPSVLQSFDSGRIVIYREADVAWWGTIPNSPSSGRGFDGRNSIELWKRGNTSQVTPFAGDQFAEINANVAGRLYQDLAVPPNTIIRWQVAHRGRAGNDTMGVYLGRPGSETAQGTFTTPNTEWRVYSGTYTVPSGQYLTRFALKAENTAGGAESSVGNLVDDVRLTNFCQPTVKGFKSVKLTNDADGNNKISPGDGLTYSLFYVNANDSTTGPAAGFQVNDPLPAGLTITATGAQTVTVSGGNTYANKNSNYTGAAAGAVSNLLNTGALLDVGGTIRIDIPVTINANASGTLLNQGTSSATEFFGQGVQTDNIDATTTSLPGGVTVPTGSVAQTQTATIDPTQITLAPNANLLLVKRITAINGNRIENPNNTSYKLNQVLDRPSFASDDAYPVNNWPDDFLKGAYDAGPIKPGDDIEYTVYFINSSGSEANSVKICDRIVGAQTFFNDGYSTGQDIEYKLGNNSIQYLTRADDATIDRAKLDGSTGAIAGCPTPSITGTNNGTVVVEITGSGSSGQQTLTNLPGAIGQGDPTNSYGYFRFKTKVN